MSCSTVTALAVVVAAAACGRLGTPAVSTGEFVTLRQGDTVKIERFAIDERRIRAEVTNTDAELDSVEAWLGADRAIDSVLITAIEGEARWIRHAVFFDSAVSARGGRVDDLRFDTTRTSTRAMP